MLSRIRPCRTGLIWFAALLVFLPVARPGERPPRSTSRQSAPGQATRSLDRGQQAAAPQQLALERIFGEPGRGGTLAEKVNWNPDGKTASYLQPTDSSDKLWLVDLSTGGKRNVHFANTAELVEKFIESRRYAEVMIFPGRGHPISDTPAQLELFRRTSDFLLHNL